MCFPLVDASLRPAAAAWYAVVIIFAVYLAASILAAIIWRLL
jgi:hypothetical protein